MLPYTLDSTGSGSPRRQFRAEDIGEWIMKYRTSDTELADLLTRDALLTKSQVGNVLRLAPGSVSKLRKAGALPAIEFRHNLVRFHPEDIAIMILAGKSWTEDAEEHGEFPDSGV